MGDAATEFITNGRRMLEQTRVIATHKPSLQDRQLGSALRDAVRRGETAILKAAAGEDPVVEFARSVSCGLQMDPRRLDCRYLYDKQGSALFDLITQQPEYYPTRTEAAILGANAGRIREVTGDVTLLELGSGYSVKTDHLLRAWLARAPSVNYIPVDVSEAALRQACEAISRVHLSARVVGVHADYREALPACREVSPVMVVFLGSTIGNLGPEDESRFLREVASSLSPSDFFLLGVDLVKDRSVIDRAYNDAAGVTAEFTRNLFARMNRELGSDIDVFAVEHVACYDSSNEQVDIHARFNKKQTIRLEPLGSSFEIAQGEMLRTEISRKYSLEKYLPYLKTLGFDAQEVFVDERRWFALILLKPCLPGLPDWRI